MKWTHRFRINAPVEALYENGFAPDRWFSFYKAYRGLISVDDHWPEEGSSIVVRYALLGPWTVQVKQTVVEHQRGRLLRLREEALDGLWIDRIAFEFTPEDGATDVTLRLDPTSRWLWGRHLVLLVWVLGAFMTPSAMKRFRAMVEDASAT